MIDAAKRARALPAWLTEKPIAHRGLHDARLPENTLPAFEAAVKAGYPIELDVHVLGDREVIVFHDDDLTRAVGVSRSLVAESRESIRGHRVFGSAFGIPTLREVLALVEGKVPLLIEIKTRHKVEGAEQSVFECLVGYSGPFAIQSFNPWSLAWFRRHAPHIVRGQLGGRLRNDGLKRFERFASERLLTLAISAPDFINYELEAMPDRWLSLLSAGLGLRVLCWTVRSESDRHKAQALGVNYVFDHIRP